MGESLPLGWAWARLGDICNVLDSKRVPVNLNDRLRRIEGLSQNNLYPYYGATGIVGFIDDYLFNGEYVLVGEDGAPFLDAYKPKAYIAKGKIWVNNHAHVIESLISSNYLCHYLNQMKYKEFVTGTTRLKLNQSKMIVIPVKIPPINEQHLIASKIDELFARLDYSTKTMQYIKTLLKVYRQAVLKYAFEGKLTEEWRQNNPTESAEELLTRIKEERQKHYDQQLADHEVGERKTRPKKPVAIATLDGLWNAPVNWSWLKTGDVMDPITNGYTPKAEFLSQNKGEVPFIKVYNLNFNGTLNFKKNPTFIPNIIHENDLRRSITHPDDVLINIVGPPLGKVSVVPNLYREFNINQAIVLFRPNNVVLSHYISYYLQNPIVINWLESTSKATAGQYNVKVSTCREIPIPLCTIEEQKKIANEIDFRLSIADHLEKTIDETLQKCESLKQSILKKAFEGKLVPQDPNDEPAEKLLERISDDREKRQQGNTKEYEGKRQRRKS